MRNKFLKTQINIEPSKSFISKQFPADNETGVEACSES